MKKVLLISIFCCTGFVFSAHAQGKGPENFPITFQKTDSAANCKSGIIMMGGQPVCKFFLNTQQISLPSGSFTAIYKQEEGTKRWIISVPKNKIIIKIGDWPAGVKNLAGVGEDLKNCSASPQSTRKAINELAKSFKNNGYNTGQRIALTIALQ